MTDDINQNDNSEGTVSIIPPSGRLPNGTFAPGNKEAAGGNRNKGWQPIGQRYIALGNKFKEKEILTYAIDAELRDRDLSYWDSFAIKKMARAIDRSLTVTDSGADQCHKEAESILDRIEGTPVQTVRTSTIPPITKSDIDNVPDSAIQETLDRLNQA